jgi:hypothetical protein
MSFSDYLDDLDAAVLAHLCDPARVLPRNGSPAVETSAALDAATEAVRFGSSEAVAPSVQARLPVAEVRRLANGDVILSPLDAARHATPGTRRWRVLGQPTRPDDGRWWLADVADEGPAS